MMLPWYVTLRLDESRTRHITLMARNTWRARWFASITHPAHTVIHVRHARYQD